jgi:hypothetical protein
MSSDQVALARRYEAAYLVRLLSLDLLVALQKSGLEQVGMYQRAELNLGSAKRM